MGRDAVREREEWFYSQRAFPLKQIPPGANRRANERRQEMLRAERERRGLLPGAQALTVSPTMWTNIGPRPSDAGGSVGLTSGRTAAVAVDPTNLDIVYIGGAQGGVWKTTDGGVTWNPLTDDQPSLAMGAIAIDPTSCSPGPCQTIYAGTGEQTFSVSSYYGAGILKSTDAGATWTHLPGPFVGPFGGGTLDGGASISSLAVNAMNSQVLLAGVRFPARPTAESGIFRSNDRGATWTLVLPGAPGTEVFFDPNNPSIAYAALGQPFFVSLPGGGTGADPDNGVYKSTNMGATWTRLTGSGSGFPQSNVGRIELAIAPSNSNILYASIADASTDSEDLLAANRMFRSTNAGASWSALPNTPDFCTPQCWYDQVIRVHPNNPNVVYAGGSAVAHYLTRSTDGGNSWTPIVQGTNGVRPHVDQHAMAFGIAGSTVRLYIGTDGGVWRADVSNPTGAINWTNLNNDLSLTQHYPGLSTHPSSEDVAIVGSQDNQTHRYSGALPWQQIGPSCDGGWTVIDPAVPSTWFITCQFTNIFRTVQSGTPFVIADDGIDLSDNVAFIPPLVGDPNVGERLYFGTFRVWQTTNNGELWTAISPNLTGGSFTIRTIAVAPSDSNVVYVGTSNGRIQRALNAGAGTAAMWDNVTTMELPVRVVRQIAFDPNASGIVYAAFSGFGSCTSCDGKGHVFRTINGGISWTDISGVGAGRLPDTPVNDIVVDPNDLTGNTLYIATDVGVFFTNDGGLNWSPLVTGLPNVAVLSLKLHPASRVLRAATHGRGVWDLQLPGLPPFHLRSISPVTAPAGSPDLTMTLMGAGFGPGSVVQFGSAQLTPTVASPTQLTVTVPGAQLAGGGVPQISVFDPGQVPNTTNSLPFTVTEVMPVLTAINPTTAMEGSGPVTLTLTGSNFVADSIARFGSANLATNFVSSTQLQATIPNSLLVGGFVQVAGFTPPPGGGRTATTITFTVTAPRPPNDDFASAIVFSGDSFSDSQNNVNATTETNDPNPGAQAACPGAGRHFSIWYRYTPAANVNVAVDTAGSAYDTVLSVWRGTALGSLTAVACDDDALGRGGPSRLTLSLTAGTTYNFMITGFGLSDAGATRFNFQVLNPPPNDNFASATVVGVVPFTDMVDSAFATTETSDPTPGCTTGAAANGRANSIWYRYTASAAGPVTADTFGSDYDTILSVWTGSSGNLVSAACNDDTGGVGVPSQVNFTAAANTTYHFMITDWDGGGGATVFRITTAPAPGPDISVGASPTSLTVTRGQSATATITVSAFAGFSGSVTLSCSGLPSRSSCSFNPASVTPGMSPASSTLTITTTAGAGLHVPPGPTPPVPVAVWWIAALLVVSALAVLRRKFPSWRWVGASVLFLVVALLLLQLACGGGGGDGGSAPPPQPAGTPPGTYAVTVTGTSGALARTTTLTLTVN